MIVVGLVLAPIALAFILLNRSFNTKRITRYLLNLSLIVSSVIYMYLCLAVKTEPFSFDIKDYRDVLGDMAVVFVFSPFLWIVLFYFASKLFHFARIRKNAKLKSHSEYIYYRDDLDKVSPGVIMYTSMFDVNVRKAVSSTILKLELTGYIKEVDNKLEVTGKKSDKLIASEQMVLNSIHYGSFDERAYKKTVRQEAFDGNYIKKNNSVIFLKIAKLLVIAAIPFVILASSINLDNYVFDNYRIYVDNNGVRYIQIDDDVAEEILQDDNVDKKDFYHTNVKGESKSGRQVYNYNYIRADKYQYHIVRWGMFLNFIVPVSVLATILMFFICANLFVNNIMYINRNYKRTSKGNELISKAYALKNYLKDFSLIRDRNKEELILWEYYMVYAVALDVNDRIENDLVEHYLNNLVTDTPTPYYDH